MRARALRPAALALAALAAGALPGCAHGPARPALPRGWALERALAAEVCFPPGELAWLSRLRCPGGERARQVSRASVGARTPTRDASDPRMLEQLDAGRPLRPGEPDLHIVDAVVVSCAGGDTTLYIDMYHCAQPPPQVAPEGMTLAR